MFLEWTIDYKALLSKMWLQIDTKLGEKTEKGSLYITNYEIAGNLVCLL